MTDPDLEIRVGVDHSDLKMGDGGQGWADLKKHISPQFGQKVREGSDPGSLPCIRH